MLNKKGATSLVTGVLILVLSVFVMIIVIALTAPFFTGLNDSLRFDGNKKNLLAINEQLLNLKNNEIGTEIDITIYPIDDIIFDTETKTITIKQEIKNTEYSPKYVQEQNYNNLNIKKENNEIIFTLDLSDIIDFNQSIILNNSRQIIKFSIVDKTNGIPTINITQKMGMINRIIITPQSGVFSYSRIVIATTIPSDCNLYYTTDGNEPDQNSTLYTGPLTITETTTLKFKAFKDGFEPSKTVTGTYTKISGVLFFNKYTDENPTIDLSENNNEVITNGVLFGNNGAYFNGDFNNYLFIKNDWNGSNTSLNLGNNNFTIEAFIKKGYTGQIFSKIGYIGSLELSITDAGLVNFSFSGSDQFWYPYDLAEDENYVYVTNIGSHSIQKRRKDNWELVLTSGGPRAATSIDGYSTPYGIAVDDQFVYISDYTNNRIIKRYKSDFSYHSMLSGGAGTADNQIRGPYGIAVDENYIYVAESYYHRVKKLDKNTFAVIAILGGTAAGSGDLQFNAPRGVAVDDTYMYVIEYGYHRIKKYNKTTFAFVSKACGTTSGSGNDQLYNPVGISVDDNFIYIADQSNSRIMIRNKTDLTYYNKITSVGLPLDDEYLYTPQMGVANDENYIYLAEYANQRIKKINKSDYSVASVYSNIIPNNENIINPFEITHDDNYLYYTDVGLHRVVKRKISDMSVVGIIGGPFAGSTTTTFSSPYGITLKDNRLYVVDYRNNAIKVFDKDTLAWVYTCTPGTSFFRYPTGIAYDENYFYATTTYSTTMDSLHKLEITDSSCTRIITIGGTNGSGNDQFNNPYGVAVDDTYVYVADTTNHRIKKHLKSDLSYVTQLGYTLYANQYINTQNLPYNILIDNNFLYVTNTSYPGIQKYTLDFNYISTIGFTSGYAYDEFLSPKGTTIANGYMYIVDGILGRITKRDMKEFDVNIQFAGAGTDFNYFYVPLSIDSDENYYYIINYGISRLEKRRKSDYYLEAYFGGPYAVTTAIGFFLNAPSDVLVDGDYVYVTDRTNHRIIKLNKSNLSYVSGFGTGAAGATNTQLSSPRQIAIYDTNIYIADTGNNRIVILNKSDMSYITAYGTTGTGTVGTNHFSGISGIAVDSSFVYTSEVTNHRIEKRNKGDLSYVTHLGGTSAGATDTTFNVPYYISIDDNYIYVGDASNNRIKKHLKSDFSYVAKIGSSGFGNDNFRAPNGVRYKDVNTLFVSDYTNNRIHIRNPSDLSFISFIDLSTYTTDGLYNPYGVAVDENYLYIADTTNNRILKKNKIDLSTVASIGGPIAGSGNDQFNSPLGITVDDQYLYVADYSNNRIVQRNKSDLSWVYSYAPGTTILRYPTGISVDDNYVYVSESGYNRIRKYNKTVTPWTLVLTIGGTAIGAGDDQFNNPRGITIDENYIYVADTTNHRIHKRNKNDFSLVQLYGIGAPYGVAQSGATGTNAFYNPYGVAVHNDILYVTDYYNNRIKVYDTNFNYIFKFGRLGWGQDMFYGPTDITIDDEYVYIADYSNHRIVKRSLAELENIKNIPKTNYVGTFGYNSNTILSYRRANVEDSQVVIKRSGNEFCIYINGIEDHCEEYLNTPTNLTFPEVNTRYGSAATTTVHYLSENQNNYPYAIGNNGLLIPGNGYLKHLRIFDTNLTDEQLLALYENER